MLKKNIATIIAFLATVLICNISSRLLSDYYINSKEINDVRTIRNLEHSRLIFFLITYLIAKFIFSLLGTFLYPKGLLQKTILSTLIFFFISWLFFSLYRTANLMILLKNPMVTIFFSPLILSGLILPLNEHLATRALKNQVLSHGKK